MSGADRGAGYQDVVTGSSNGLPSESGAASPTTKLKFLAPLCPDDRAYLDQLKHDVRTFGPRQDVIRVGERPEHINLMLTGWTCLYQVVRDGRRQITALLLSGDSQKNRAADGSA